MVSTRTQTGVLKPQKYDAKTLQQNSIIPVVPAASGSSKVQKSRGRTKRSGKRIEKQAANKPEKINPGSSQHSHDDDQVTEAQLSSDLAVEEVEELVRQQEQYELPEVTRAEVDLNDGIPNFFPKTVTGAREDRGKSKIERANKQIEKWKEIREAHEEHYPRILPFIEGKIREAERARAELEDNEENNRIG